MKRIHVAILLTVLSAAARAAGQEPGVLDLTGDGLVFEGKVSAAAPAAEGACAVRDEAVPPSPGPVVCSPDPYPAICSLPRHPELQKKYARTRSWVSRLDKLELDAFQGAIEPVLRTLGDVPAVTDSRRAVWLERYDQMHKTEHQHRREEAYQKLRPELLALQPKVNAAYREALAAFQTMFSRSRLAGGDQAWLKALANCVPEPTLAADQLGANARMGGHSFDLAGLDAELRRARAYGQDLLLTQGKGARPQPGQEDINATRVNPAELTARESRCVLGISPHNWVDCADGGPACAAMLLHELGHVFNSCLFVEKARVAGQIPDFLPDGDPLGPAAKVLERQYLRVAEEMQSVEMACLETLSAPKSAVINSCPSVREKLPLWAHSRCASVWNGSVRGKPSQWLEAEADFRAASALAEWIRASARSPDDSRSLMTQALQHACDEDRWSERIGAMLGKSAVETLRKINALRAAPTVPAESAKTPQVKPGCDQIPRSNPMSSASARETWDEHQPRDLRFNRNYLRNSDLRRALGCPARPDIPLTCSPTGELRMNLDTGWRASRRTP